MEDIQLVSERQCSAISNFLYSWVFIRVHVRSRTLLHVHVCPKTLFHVHMWPLCISMFMDEHLAYLSSSINDILVSILVRGRFCMFMFVRKHFSMSLFICAYCWESYTVLHCSLVSASLMFMNVVEVSDLMVSNVVSCLSTMIMQFYTRIRGIH